MAKIAIDKDVVTDLVLLDNDGKILLNIFPVAGSALTTAHGISVGFFQLQ